MREDEKTLNVTLGVRDQTLKDRETDEFYRDLVLEPGTWAETMLNLTKILRRKRIIPKLNEWLEGEFYRMEAGARYNPSVNRIGITYKPQ